MTNINLILFTSHHINSLQIIDKFVHKDFSHKGGNTVLVMTSNAGTSFKSAGIGFGGGDAARMPDRVNSVLKEVFRPEFINRVDSVVIFKELGADSLKEIIKLMLIEVEEEAEANGIELRFDDTLPDFFLQNGYDKNFGARPFRRMIQEQIEDELSDRFIRGLIKRGDRMSVTAADGKIEFHTETEPNTLQ